MSGGEFFAFLHDPGADFSHIHVAAGEEVSSDLDQLPRRRSVRSWYPQVDLTSIQDALVEEVRLLEASTAALSLVLIAPEIDRETYRRYTQLYGSAPAYVSYTAPLSTFSHLSEARYVDLHIDIGRSAQRLWLRFVRRELGCLPLGRVEGGRIHDLPDSGMRPLFTMAVGVPRDEETSAG